MLLFFLRRARYVIAKRAVLVTTSGVTGNSGTDGYTAADAAAKKADSSRHDTMNSDVRTLIR